MSRGYVAAVLVALLFPAWARPQKYESKDGTVQIALVVNPYGGDRAGPELDGDAEAMTKGGLMEMLSKAGASVEKISTVALTPEQERAYGRWNRFGLANRHLAEFVSANERAGIFNIGLYNNCSSALGTLGGLQHAGRAGEASRIGLVWIDAHADFNTPETTLSGMLGGMPVAIAAGHCLTRMRVQSGLDPAVAEQHVLMACARDTDPLEQDRLARSSIQQISVEDIRLLSSGIRRQMERLSSLTDLIYVHIDLDVLDPKEVPGHPLKVPNGPTSKELGEAVRVMFQYPKTAALGIASYPAQADPEQVTLRAVHHLIERALKGIQAR